VRRTLLFACFCAALCAQTVKYTYDNEGRLTKADYGAKGTVAYTYDAAGNLVNRQVQSTANSNAPVITSVVNGAKFTAGPGIVPGEFISIFATNLGSVDQITGFPATSFQGVSVLFNGKPAPLFALIASKNQINLVVPTELASSGSVSVQVQNGAGAGPALPLSLAPADVGIFLVADPSAASRKNAAMRFSNSAWYVMSTAMATAYGLPACTGLPPNASCGQPARVGDAI
jgi:YD repeat-containing protein